MSKFRTLLAQFYAIQFRFRNFTAQSADGQFFGHSVEAAVGHNQAYSCIAVNIDMACESCTHFMLKTTDLKTEEVPMRTYLTHIQSITL